jgi:DeoR/GlpR family transcriptional regulator of sugar metabolism
MSARGLFYEILPLLESHEPYGHIELTVEELSKQFRVSEHMMRRYIFELVNHRILKRNQDGTLLCPMLVRNKFAVK